MKIFVTGAAGFIGGSIAAGLVKAGHEVIGLIRNPEQIAELQKIGVTGVVGSLDDRDLLVAQARAADAIINAASSDNRAAVEVDTSGAEIGPVLRRSVEFPNNSRVVGNPESEIVKRASG